MIFWHFFLPKLLLLVYCFSDCIYFFTPNHALGKFFPNTDCLCFCVSCIYFDAFACFLTFSIILSKQRNISFVPDFFNLPWRYTKKKLLPTVQNNFSHQKPIRYFSGLTECCPLCISNPKSSVLKKNCKAKKSSLPCKVCDASDAHRSLHSRQKYNFLFHYNYFLSEILRILAFFIIFCLINNCLVW